MNLSCRTKRPLFFAHGLLVILASLALPVVATSQAHLIRTLEGPALGDRFGQSVASVGDLDADGVPELLVGAPGPTNGTSKAYVISGKTGKFLSTLTGTGNFGTAVVGLGDVNKDGIADFAISAPGNGIVTIFSGRGNKVIHTLRGAASEEFGFMLSNAGDLNADGADDLIVGARAASLRKGAVDIFSSRDGKLLRRIWGEKANDDFGTSATSLQDINGDKVPDFAVGANRGAYVSVHSGKDFSLLYVLRGKSQEDEFGASLANPGDVDGDDIDDLIVSVPLFPRAFSPNFGLAKIYSGKSGRLLFEVRGTIAGSPFVDVGAAGDVDGNGIPDFIVGTPSDSSAATNGGAATVYSGKDGKLLLQFQGVRNNEGVGRRVGSVGDLNEDGQADLFIGAETFNPNRPSRVYLYSGLGGGTHAAFFPMFSSSGSKNKPQPLLIGTKAPVLGRLMAMDVRAAGFDFAILLQTMKATRRPILVRLGPWPLAVHIDPASILNAFVVPLSPTTGIGTFSGTLPKEISLIGMNQAWQAVTFFLGGQGDIAATNLLGMTLGTDAKEGIARLGYEFSASISRNTNFRSIQDPGNAMPVYINTGPWLFLTLRGTFSSRSKKRLIEVRTAPGVPNVSGGGLLLATIIGNPTFRIRFWVPPGTAIKPTRIYFLNPPMSLGDVELSWFVERIK